MWTRAQTAKPSPGGEQDEPGRRGPGPVEPRREGPQPDQEEDHDGDHRPDASSRDHGMRPRFMEKAATIQ